ncbi:MAG: GNAT family N-acetyltransferase [Candidatus Eremiobacteraeota bacterium]|nr:GNAT family N-acetyltransferase [Candidatus Eremiobacteraeota bacterium]
MNLTDGYHPVPPGKLANVQTFLEMRAKPPLRPSPADPSWNLERLPADLQRYRALFHRVGDEYLWAARLLMPEAQLQDLLEDSRLEVYALATSRGDEGLLELDFRVDRECELVLFGVAAALVNTGAGRWLMNRALEVVWSHPVDRFWLHTCTLDHPSALAFYRRTGFTPYERRVEVYDDPRVLGLTRRDAASRMPIL